MRDDQYTKLKALQEKLIDVVLVEADPAAWSGEGKALHQLSRDDRGDRYWSKKNASATLSVLMKVTSLTGVIERNMAGEPADSGAEEKELDGEIKRAEREATKILRKLQDRSRATPKH